MITYQKQQYPVTQLRKTNHKNVKNQQYHQNHPKGDFSSNQQNPQKLRDFQAFHPGRLTWNIIHRGLVQIIFLSQWVICRFQPFIFQGVSLLIFLGCLAFLHGRAPGHLLIPGYQLGHGAPWISSSSLETWIP